MSQSDDFELVIDSNLRRLTDEIDAINKNIADPAYHRERVRSALVSAFETLNEIDENMRQAELVSIVNQMPNFVAAAWTEAADRQRKVSIELKVWEDVYQNWKETREVVQEDEPKSEPQPVGGIDDDFLEAVRVGDIKEPSRMTSIRRKPGTRPESLRKVRKAKEIIQNSPEQK